MPAIAVLGAGPCGLAAALMLARDGHRVTVLERDAEPVPASAELAWERWTRRGVTQFRQARFLHARGAHVLAAELPDVRDALAAAGALTVDTLHRLPAGITDREPRPGDDRLTTLTARRPAIEHAVAAAAEREAGLEVRRGTTVAGLDAVRGDGALRITGVRTATGERVAADLVVDAMGRRSALPGLLADAGADPGVVDEAGEDSGFVYYSRFFRAADGASVPAPRAPLLTPIGSFSVLTLPGDRGTWSVTLFSAAGDRPLKLLRHADAWTALVRACPLHAHWLDGEPITDVLPMGGVLDRHRRLDAGRVVGVASVADAWACTNPSLGRGIALGLAHAARLRDVVREHGAEPAALARAWDEVTQREFRPWYEATISGDRARLAEINALRAGAAPPVPADPGARLRAALPLAMAVDPDVFRAGMEILCCLTLPSEVFARPGFAARVLELAAGRDAPPRPGPDRAQVLDIVTGAGAPVA